MGRGRKKGGGVGKVETRSSGESVWKNYEKSSLPPKVLSGSEKGEASLTTRQFHGSTEIESAVCNLSRRTNQGIMVIFGRPFFLSVADLVNRILWGYDGKIRFDYKIPIPSCSRWVPALDMTYSSWLSKSSAVYMPTSWHLLISSIDITCQAFWKEKTSVIADSSNVLVRIDYSSMGMCWWVLLLSLSALTKNYEQACRVYEK